MRPIALALVLSSGLATACGPAASTGPGVPPPAVAAPTLVGQWTGCDGRIVEFTDEGGQLIGRYIELGGLDQYGFSVDEVGYRYTPDGAGGYTGQVKWRFAGGGEEWRESTATVTGDTYEDTASDNCSRTLERVGSA